MRTSKSGFRRSLLAGSVVLLPFASAAALAQDAGIAEIPPPHWSGLPIWGPEAAARGYQLPLPLGIGVTLYSARQPVNIQDLRLGRANPPVSVTNFLQIDRVDTSQQNVSAKFDVLVFPFLDVYALGGYTTGTTKGVIQVPATPGLDFTPAQLRLNARFEGPTYGWGMTLQGGAKVGESQDLLAFAVADVNQTRTDLSFSNEQLLASTKPKATIFSARLGLNTALNPSTQAAIWIGAMYQRIQQEVAGTVANTDLQFIVSQSAAKPWNTLLGGLIDIEKKFNILIEGGLGTRVSILAAIGYRF